MVAYSIALIASIMLCALSNKLKGRQRSIFRVLSTFPLFFIAAIRYDVGTDYFYTYVPVFMRIAAGSYAGYITPTGSIMTIEPGYQLLNYIVSRFTDNYVWIFAVTALIFICFVYKAIYEQSVAPCFSIFLLVAGIHYFSFLNGMRQMIVAAVFLYAVRYLDEKKYITYVIVILLAATIHISALVYLPFLLLANININKKKAWICLGIVTALMMPLGNLIRTIISKTQYGWYLSSNYDNVEGGYITTAIQLAIFLLISLYMKNNVKKSTNVYYWCALISAIVGTMFRILPGPTRIMMIFTLPSIISIPYAVSTEHSTKARFLLKNGIIVIYSIYVIYSLLVNNTNGVMPFQTVFGGDL